MENLKPIDVMSKCPVCGTTAVFDKSHSDEAEKIKFYVHCPECGLGTKKIYTAGVFLSYTGDMVLISSEVNDAINDWNSLVHSYEKSNNENIGTNRTSISFSNDVYEYIKGMARFKGITMSEFSNEILKKSMEEDEAYKFILEARKKLDTDGK